MPALHDNQLGVMQGRGNSPARRYAGDSTWITRLASMSFTFAP